MKRNVLHVSNSFGSSLALIRPKTLLLSVELGAVKAKLCRDVEEYLIDQTTIPV